MIRAAIAHLRAQWMGALSLFLVLAGGTAYAANTIGSGDIVDGQVKTLDLAANAVTSSKIADAEVKEADIGQGAVATAELKNDAVTNAKVLNESLVGADVLNNSLKGADIDESTLSNVGGGGAAGGDLTGAYPNPQIAFNAVGGPEVANDSLGGFDVQESSLGQVPSASNAANADSVNGKSAAQLEGARAFALVRAWDCPEGFCKLLRSKRVAYAFHAAEGKFCVGVDGISAADPTSLPLVAPTSYPRAESRPYAYWRGGIGSNEACVGTEFEIDTGIAPNPEDIEFTIVIP